MFLTDEFQFLSRETGGSLCWAKYDRIWDIRPPALKLHETETLREHMSYTSWSHIDVRNKKALFRSQGLYSMSPFMLINSQLNTPHILLSPKVQCRIHKPPLQPDFNHMNTDDTSPMLYYLSYYYYYRMYYSVLARPPSLHITPVP
jgi:hypothetical protein